MRTTLLETTLSESVTIDTDAGVIRDVKILGAKSRNGRRYSDRAMNDGVRLYEGQTINLDHNRKEPRGERGFLEGVGFLRNVRRSGDGVYGDLHYLKSHPAAPVLIESAQRFPDKFGLSHNAEGDTKQHGRETVVESLDKVRSVDIVRNPATNSGLFESENTVPTTLKEIIESQFPETSKGCALLEMDGMAAMPVQTSDGMGSDQQIKAAFEAAILAAFGDDSLDAKATVKKVGEIIRAYYKLTGTTEAAAEGESEGAEAGENAMESLLESLKAEFAAKFNEINERLARAEKDAKRPPLMESKFGADRRAQEAALPRGKARTAAELAADLRRS